MFLVEGLRPIGELLASSFTTELILYSPGGLTSPYGNELLDKARTAGVTTLSTSEEILDDLSGKQSAAGMIAVARKMTRTFAGLLPDPAGWSVALVAPQDPGNLGTILRTMDAFRAGSLFLLDGGADPWQPGAVRASMGALFNHAIVEGTFGDFAAWAVGEKVPLFGTSAHASEDIHHLAAAPTPAVLLFGPEREGLTPAQQAVCAEVLRIPIHGRGTSLNLAVAAGVALYLASLGDSAAGGP
jgi:TrmH family RNA methyltransferase